ncbi:hypothetical protein [Xanthomonas campestris]|uniref:hypothetical protein n=1 Tax=Xanthomonas campestris TaxID=339 RepID=UPI00137952C1|nr:hypothetical protein [Xanthomonas campestris]
MLFIAGATAAHEDRILSLRPDGRIAELPAQLGHTFLKMSNLGTTTPTVQFISSNRRITLPGCIAKLITSRRASDVSVAGSWYHDEAVLPYYVVVTFNDAGSAAPSADAAGLRIMYNLRTAQIIEIDRVAPNSAGIGAKLRLPAGCLIPQPRSADGLRDR